MNKVTTYYLEMKSPTLLNEKTESNGLQVHECEIKQYQFNKFLYQFIGGPWDWTNKLSLSDEQWRAHVENDNLRTWLAQYKGAPAGYYELQQQDDGNVEILYFGLATKFIGQGFGGYLLSHAIKSGLAVGTNKKSMGAYLHPRPSTCIAKLQITRHESLSRGNDRSRVVTPKTFWIAAQNPAAMTNGTAREPSPTTREQTKENP